MPKQLSQFLPQRLQRFDDSGASDSIHFSGASFSFTPHIEVADGASVSEKFRTLAKAGFLDAFHAFPEPLQETLLEQGFRAVLAEKPTDAMKTLEDILTPDELEYQLEEAREIAMEGVASLFGNLFMSDETLKPLILQRILEDFEEDKKTASPVFLHGLKAIVLPEAILPFLPEGNAEGAFTRIIRHEAAHFIDTILGRAETGQNFSADPAFREKLLDDLWSAEKTGTLPAPETPNEFGTPLSYYLPQEGSQLEGFEESFAEIVAGLYGDGAWPQDFIRNLFPGATEYVRDRIMSRFTA